MFQPRPTPFAASCFSSYGVTDFSFPLTLQTGGGVPQQSQQQPGQNNLGSHAHAHPHSHSHSSHSSHSLSPDPVSAHSHSHSHSHPHSHSEATNNHHHGGGSVHSHGHNHSGLHQRPTPQQLQQHQREQQHQALPHSHNHNHSHAAHPHSHPHQLSHQQHHQQSHPQSIIFSTPSHASTSSSVSPVASLHGHFSPASNSLSPPYNSSVAKMEHDDQSQLLQDELAAQEAAAREYQPQLEGPMVGEKTPTTAIMAEYAKADPIYVEKTMALPEMYSHYRPIQGDGNCGWRAIGFAYFETLIRLNDSDKIQGEVARIMSLNQVLVSAGYDPMMFEPMADETIMLLREIAASVSNYDTAMNILTERFNNREVAPQIIYHLRLLAGAWMKSDPSPYEPFIPEGLGVAGYCESVIERVDREIDQVGIHLLVNVLLKPIDLILEIAYLDRSPGSQVNRYRFPDEANNQPDDEGGPFIYLLFRPDHYDILYKTPVLQVNRVASFTHQHEIAQVRELDTYGAANYSALALLPGFFSTPSMPSMGPALSSSIGGDFSSLATAGQWMPAPAFTETIPSHPAPRPAPPQVSRPARVDVVTPVQSRAPTATASVSPPVVPTPPAAPPARAPMSQTTYPLRFSSQCYRLETSTFPEPHFQTATFKNSHYNRAHYSNPDFHPEEWTPDDDSGEGSGRGGSSKRKGRHKHEA